MKKIISGLTMYNDIKDNKGFEQYLATYGVKATLSVGIDIIAKCAEYESLDEWEILEKLLKAIRPRNEQERDCDWFENICAENKIKPIKEWEYGEITTAVPEVPYWCDFDEEYGEEPYELNPERWLVFNDLNGNFEYIS